MRRALITLVAALALTVVPLGAAETSYTDAVGDSRTAPDITAVNVSNTDTGLVTFKVSANLGVDMALAAILNTDLDMNTGMNGFDRMAFVMTPGGAMLTAVVDPATGQVVPGVTISATSATGVVTFSFQKEAFGVTDAFGFGLLSMNLQNKDIDMAPEAGFAWIYMLTKPAPPPPPVVVKPVIGKPVVLAAPVAGKRFTVAFPVVRSDDGTPLTTGAVACKTTVAGKTVPHTHTFKSGTVKATLVVPKAAKGKQLKIAVKVTAGSQAATKVVTFKVK